MINNHRLSLKMRVFLLNLSLLKVKKTLCTTFDLKVKILSEMIKF